MPAEIEYNFTETTTYAAMDHLQSQTLYNSNLQIQKPHQGFFFSAINFGFNGNQTSWIGIVHLHYSCPSLPSWKGPRIRACPCWCLQWRPQETAIFIPKCEEQRTIFFLTHHTQKFIQYRSNTSCIVFVSHLGRFLHWKTKISNSLVKSQLYSNYLFLQFLYARKHGVHF